MAYVNNVGTESTAVRKKEKTQANINTTANKIQRTIHTIKSLENLEFYFTMELPTQTEINYF